MSFTFNDYFSLLEDEDIQGSQLILFSDISTGIQLLQKHEALGCTKLFLADIIEADNPYLPMPEVLVPRLAEKIQSLEGRIVVSGIDAYLSLLHPDQNSQFVAAIKNLLDTTRLNAVFLMCSSELIQNYFKNPRYEDGLSVVRIKATGNSDEPCNLPSVKIVSDKWAPAGDVCTNYRDLLIRLNSILTVSPDGATQPEPFTILALRDLQHSQAGTGIKVSFCLELPDIAQQFYGLKEASFSLQTLEVLLPKCKQSNESALEWLERTFGKENINSGGDIFKRALELPDDSLWEAYLWMLRKTITPGTYAAKVLSGEITHDTLLKRIVVDTALEVLDETRNDPYKKRPDYAAQRAQTLQKLDYNFQALVDDFVNKTQSDPNALEFLNGKRDSEFCEIIRRTGKTDLIEGTAVAEAVKKLYPALGEYLWPHYGYGDKTLDDYFQDYRRLKFQNRITPEFVQRAFDATVPVSIENRDLLLNELLTDEQTGVLVVDGMGAEYYPLLLGLAKQNGLKIESSRVVSVNLPTTTEFNPLSRTPVFDTISIQLATTALINIKSSLLKKISAPRFMLLRRKYSSRFTRG